MAADAEASIVPTLAASASANSLARIPCHPIDTIKAKLQVQGKATGLGSSSVTGGPLSAARTVLRTEGVGGLYSGIGITILGAIPAGCLYYTSYELAKEKLDAVLPGWTVTNSLTAGFAAEAFSCVLWVPIDVVKERLQVQSALPQGHIRYRSSFDALRTICLQEGFGGIYRGYMATLYSFGPFSAFYFGFYEKSKSAAAAWHETEVKALPMPSVVACSAVAGSAAAWLSSPLDMIKLRIQVQRRAAAAAAAQATTAAGAQAAAEEQGFTFAYRGMMDGVGTVFREEGAAALWKGAGTRVAFMVPQSAISMVAFEWCKRHYTTLWTGTQ